MESDPPETTPHPPPSRWSELPEGLLLEFLARLPARDRYPFAQVCRSWRQLRRLHLPQPLIVSRHAFPQSTDPCGFSLRLAEDPRRCFRKLSRVFVFPRPTWRLPCWGNTGGAWLAETTYIAHMIHLVNPISGEQIDLPPMDLSMGVYAVTLSSPPTPISGDCTVVGLIPKGHNGVKLAMCMVGGDKWETSATLEDFRQVSSMAFFEGELCLISEFSYSMAVYAVDPRLTFRGFVGEMGDNDLPEILVLPTRWLFESRGELFMLIKFTLKEAGEFFEKLRVFRLEGKRWVSVPDLGDRCILISFNRADCICHTGEFMGMDVKKNRVYECMASSDLCVYSIENGRKEEVITREEDGKVQGWIVPNGWW